MIRLYIHHLVGLKGAEHPQAYLIGLGFTAREARTLAHGHEAELLQDDVLQRLCEGLLCTPNDVLSWYGPGDHPLVALNASGPQLKERLQASKSAAEAEELLTKALEAMRAEVPPQRMAGGRLFLNVERLLRLRQVKKPRRELMRMGFTASEAQRLLSSDRKGVRVKVLTRLCEAFQCLPNELYDFEGPEGHVLQAVRKPGAVNLDAGLAGLTEEQLRRVVQAVWR
ncbi:MAG: helix-turn-helix transcriptional regulator [Flavobacteriales bacterium]|nr:helix-turn-helix transcriptional regulator [Flavobacteriales bacterium]